MRIFVFGFFALIAAYFFLQENVNRQQPAVLPVFLQQDAIALRHTTNTTVTVQSLFKPDSFALAKLKDDYANIWAHLNAMYATNDIEAGKEYYTEHWFKQLARHYKGEITTGIQRSDEAHHLQIKNWSTDGLACNLIDSNAVLTYRNRQGIILKSNTTMAVTLLLQGDHWRIDALAVVDEREF